MRHSINLIGFEFHDGVSRKHRGFIISTTVLISVVIVCSISRRVLFHRCCLQNNNSLQKCHATTYHFYDGASKHRRCMFYFMMGFVPLSFFTRQ